MFNFTWLGSGQENIQLSLKYPVLSAQNPTGTEPVTTSKLRCVFLNVKINLNK